MKLHPLALAGAICTGLACAILFGTMVFGLWYFAITPSEERSWPPVLPLAVAMGFALPGIGMLVVGRQREHHPSYLEKPL